MIRLARSRRLTRLLQANARGTALAARFVSGGEETAAVRVATALREQGFKSSLFYLGEYVDDGRGVARNVAAKLTIAAALGEAGLEVHVSVDPTQIGYAISDELGAANAERIAAATANLGMTGAGCLMLDMEDFSLVDKTLALHRRLDAAGLPVGITIQAYLRRSAGDLESLVAGGATVRLVKGAFAEDRDRAWTRRADIDRNYMRLVETMLSEEARSSGFAPVFATHDDSMIGPIKARAESRGWSVADYEFEMLYGVRPALQRALRDAGLRVRLYLPYGEDWWPYAARRIGENPRNALFVARAVLARR